ncbi:MAG: protein-tyrosine phosphatase [Polyangiales bacterium]|jgi:protein-tyrosine phosphatase
MVRVCFVCLGNICRSPTAEGVMRSLLEDRTLAESVHVESAGTSGWHVGERPDPRSRAAASTRGVVIDGQAQHFQAKDFERFDYIVGLDSSNRDDLIALASNEAERAKVQLFLDFTTSHQGQDVPDPYYGGANGFEHVLDLCESACTGLLEHMSARGEV